MQYRESSTPKVKPCNTMANFSPPSARKDGIVSAIFFKNAIRKQMTAISESTLHLQGPWSLFTCRWLASWIIDARNHEPINYKPADCATKPLAIPTICNIEIGSNMSGRKISTNVEVYAMNSYLTTALSTKTEWSTWADRERSAKGAARWP